VSRKQPSANLSSFSRTKRNACSIPQVSLAIIATCAVPEGFKISGNRTNPGQSKGQRQPHDLSEKKQRKLLTGHEHGRSMRRGVKWSKVDSTIRTQVKTSANRGIVSTASRNQSQCYAEITQRESTRRAGSKFQLSFAAMSKRSTARRCI